MDVQIISHYRVVRRLGAGGMGEVFLGEDMELERSVALKVMSPELAKDPNQRKRFRAEAKAASGLVHPNICVIHEVGETKDGRPFLAMEYVRGQTLDVLLQQCRLRLREILNLGIEVAEALDAAHMVGIVHRDIKTANIMLDQRGRAKVLDFGLAKRFSENELASTTTSVPQTKTGMLIGTPHYMSPEQALGRELDPRTDIFSLGVVLYELIAGQRPFLGATVGEVINNVINQPPEPLGVENPVFAPALDRIVGRCLEKDPRNRYASAKGLAEDLARLQAEIVHAAGEDKTRAGAAPGPPKQPAGASVPRLPPTTRKRPSLAPRVTGIALAVVALIALGLWYSFKHGTSSEAREKKIQASGPPQNSVAVLPFDNFSSEPNTDYLSDGLTEEITTALSRIHGLKVAARNSAFTFKGKKEDARKVGEALQVATLLGGSIQKLGKRIHVNVQLINVADGFHLWSETYDRSEDDALLVQEDIARHIAERLQVAVHTTLEAHKPRDPEAYKLYLQARVFWNKRTQTGSEQAVKLFQEAIKKQPDYAEAYAGLAATYHIMPEYSTVATVREYVPLARAAATRALELDPACAEAHAVLGSVQAAPPARDLNGAEQHFRRAMELDPNYATAHHWYGRYLLLHGDRNKALAEFQTAVDLDPLSPAIRSTIPGWYYMTGDFDRAIAECQRVIAAFPDFPPARFEMVTCYFMKGEYDQALKEIDATRALQPETPIFGLELRGYALARLSRQEEAQKILDQLANLRQQGKPMEGAMGIVYLGLRDYDKAVDAFEKAVDRDGLPEEFLCDPFMNEVRNLPRVQALLKKAQAEEVNF
jgi:serine/threonine protein kinase/tetratricopeptide (TPR) repeat protein